MPEEEVKAVALEINQAFVRNDYEGVMKHIAEDITWFSHTNTKRQDGKKIFGESMKKTLATKKTLRWQEYRHRGAGLRQCRHRVISVRS